MHEWYPSECAPVTAPVEIVSGQFITRDGLPIRIPSGSVVNNGWGAIGSTFIADPIEKALPAKLQLRWFSYAENKFYGGDFAIDAQHFDSLFEAGYVSPIDGGKKVFDRIVVGMAPGGGVALWLKGEQITKEVAFFRAAEIQEDWNAFSNESPRSRGEYVQAQLEQVLERPQIGLALQGAKAGLTLWDEAYRKRYQWSPKLISRGRIKQLLVRYYNGEVLLNPGSGTVQEHPLPEQLDLYWSNPDGVDYGATIRFEFAELSGAFERLAPGGALLLNLEADTLSTEVAVFLQNKTETYRFKNARLRVFRM
jgi:hypothetical protein